MIGDNPESDIAGGIAKGWITILVKTGCFDPKATSSENGNDKKFPADYVVDDFQAAIKLIYKLEKLPWAPIPDHEEPCQPPPSALNPISLIKTTAALTIIAGAAFALASAFKRSQT